MKKLLLLAGILASTLLFSQDPSFQWKRVNKGAFSGNEQVLCSARDNAGNNYMCGYNASSTWIAKFDNTGANTFAFTYVDSSNAYITPVKLFVDGSGNIYMIGSKNDMGNVNPIVVKFNSVGQILWTNYFSTNTYNIVDDALLDNATNPNYVFYTGRINDSLGIVKVNAATGATVWKRQLNPSGNSYSRGVGLAYLNGNIYATGITFNPTTFLNAYTVKLNSTGTTLYANESNLTGIDNSEHILVNSSGDAFVFGVASNTGFARFYLKRLSTGGNVTWTTNLYPTIQGGGVPSSLVSVGMAANISNTAFYLVGGGYNPNINLRAQYTFVVNSSGAVVDDEEYSNGANLDPIAIRSDNAGNFFVMGKQDVPNPTMYVEKFGSSGGSYLYHSAYVTQTTNPPVDLYLDNNSNVYATSNVYRNSVNLGDGLIVKFGQTGNLIWDGIYDGQANGYDYGNKVFVASNGQDIYTGGAIQNNGTGRDVMIKLYDTHGNEQWATTIDMNATDDYFLDMAQDQYNVSYLLYSNSNQGYITKIDNIGSQLYNVPVTANYGKIKENRNNWGVYVGYDGFYNSMDYHLEAFDFQGNYSFGSIPASVPGGYTQVRAIEYDNAGNVYLFGNIYNPGTNVTGMAVQKLDNTGIKQWDAVLSGFDDAYFKNGVDMKFNSNGDLIVMGVGVKPGETKGSIVLATVTTSGVASTPVFYSSMPNVHIMNPLGFQFNGSDIVVYGKTDTSPTSSQGLIAKFDAALNFQWMLPFASAGMAQDAVNDVTISGTDIYVTGMQTVTAQQSAVLMAKVDNAGSIVWSKNYSGAFAGYNEGKSIGVNNDRVYVVGSANESPGQQFDMVVLKYCANPEPVISVGGSTLICSNDTAVLYTSSGTNPDYTWQPGNLTGSFIQVSASGYYYVTAMESDGCTRISDSVQITIKTAPVVPSICAVTVDSLSTHNILQWDKSMYTDLSHFNIYREDATNIYTPIGSVPFDSLSEYHDYIANPNITTKRYKLSAVDTCGVESALSNYHNTIYIVYSGSGQYNWNLYTIENASNPVTNYLLMREDVGSSGIWSQVGSTAGTQGNLNDPDFALYPSGRWRVETAWGITCNPTRGAINTSRSNVKSPNSAIGIESYGNSAAISIYPNPATDQVNVSFGSAAPNTKVSIYDAVGKLVYEADVKTGQQEVQISTALFGSGIYMLQLSNENGKFMKKLFVE
jgi:hypothetical protein